MTAAEILLKRKLIASGISSNEWEIIQTALKNRAFFSARIEKLKFLSRAQRRLVQLLAKMQNADGAITSRAQVVSDLMQAAKEMGISTGTGDITDPGRTARAKLIVDTNAAMAVGEVRHAVDTTEGAQIAFPAWEFVRIENRRRKRGDWPARWRAAGGRIYKGRMIALKDSPVWAQLSRFGNPWPPFDYGSGMGQRDISREECIELGIIKPDYLPENTDPAETHRQQLATQLKITGEDDLAWRYLKDTFGDQITRNGNTLNWTP
jgi:hypothetical protein